jgi:hypothetical protein
VARLAVVEIGGDDIVRRVPLCTTAVDVPRKGR